MYGSDIIKRYFSANPDNLLDDDFRENAGFFNTRNCVYAFERIDSSNLKFYFKDRIEYRDQPIIENGVKVGMVRLATPHTIQVREGTFICSGVSKFTEKSIIGGWKSLDVDIHRSFWTKKICLNIKNEHMNVSIVCKLILPDSYSSETITNQQ